jgi:hypothetical protein
MIRLMISVAFGLTLATSAEAMSPAPLHEPDARVTHIADKPCNLPGQVRINGICMLRTTPHPVRQRDYRGCAKWNEGICVEYY